MNSWRDYLVVVCRRFTHIHGAGTMGNKSFQFGDRGSFDLDIGESLVLQLRQSRHAGIDQLHILV